MDPSSPKEVGTTYRWPSKEFSNENNNKEHTLINIFPAPLLRELGSRLEYMILIGFPLIGVKLSSSSARAAAIDL
jgi:hypothetical protein